MRSAACSSWPAPTSTSSSSTSTERGPGQRRGIDRDRSYHRRATLLVRVELGNQV
jgi:hypothetical protein